jgi:hypothetical protein
VTVTYSLEVEREGKRSDHHCDCKGSGDDIHTGGGEGEKRSDHSCDCKGSRDDIQSGGGEGRQEVRSSLRMQREQGQHTDWRWRVVAIGQITVATAKGAGTTYSLEVEREGKRSDHHCDCKGSWDNVLPGGAEGGQEVRSQL